MTYRHKVTCRKIRKKTLYKCTDWQSVCNKHSSRQTYHELQSWELRMYATWCIEASLIFINLFHSDQSLGYDHKAGWFSVFCGEQKVLDGLPKRLRKKVKYWIWRCFTFLKWAIFPASFTHMKISEHYQCLKKYFKLQWKWPKDWHFLKLSHECHMNNFMLWFSVLEID